MNSIPTLKGSQIFRLFQINSTFSCHSPHKAHVLNNYQKIITCTEKQVKKISSTALSVLLYTCSECVVNISQIRWLIQGHTASRRLHCSVHRTVMHLLQNLNLTDGSVSGCLKAMSNTKKVLNTTNAHTIPKK